MPGMNPERALVRRPFGPPLGVQAPLAVGELPGTRPGLRRCLAVPYPHMHIPPFPKVSRFPKP